MDQHSLPPHSVEAEQAVLGCVLVDPSLIDRMLTETSGDEDAFYDVRHKVIFNAISGMSAAGIPTDLVTIQQWLRDRKNLEICGGRGYLAELPDKIATPAMFGTYMAVVSDKWKLRRALTRCLRLWTASSPRSSTHRRSVRTRKVRGLTAEHLPTRR
jgi:replicative DNA helicase